MRHCDRELFVAAGQELRLAVSTVIDDGLLNGIEARSGIRRDVFNPERLDDIGHEVRCRVLDDRGRRRLGRPVLPQVMPRRQPRLSENHDD